MGSVYKKGATWYIRFKDVDGIWRDRSARTAVKRDAVEVLQEVERLMASQAPEHLTVREWAAKWQERRAKRGYSPRTADRVDGQLRLHVLPEFGDRRLDSIRPSDVRRWVASLEERMAPRSALGIYHTARALFADAVAEDLLTSHPFVLRRTDLPESVDHDPDWRAGADFSRAEAEAIIGHPGLSEYHRMLWTLLFLTGMRIGEVRGLRWRDVDGSPSPLGMLRVSRSGAGPTKTRTPRQVPIHPTLRQVLGRWRVEGWPEFYGRTPSEDDFVLPMYKTADRMLGRNCTAGAWAKVLKDLGLRHRRIHDTRRTFITLARVDGARADILRHVTHGGRGMIDLYSALPWPLLCEAVSCLQLRDPRTMVVELPMAVGAEGQTLAAPVAAGAQAGGENACSGGTLENVTADVIKRSCHGSTIQDPGKPGLYLVTRQAQSRSGEGAARDFAAADTILQPLREALALLHSGLLDEAVQHLTELERLLSEG